MEFNSDRRKAAMLVALVFVLGVAFGVAGVLGGRRVLGARGGGEKAIPQGNQQVSQLVHDLGLTTDQEKQFRQILADTRARYNAIRDAMEPQFGQVRSRNRERIEQILTADQKPLFEDFLRQSRNNNRRNDAGTRTPGGNASSSNSNVNRNGQPSLVTRLTQQLHLTTEQQSELHGILTDTRASFDALRQQMNAQVEEARLQNRDRIRQVVPAQQRPKLEAYFQRRDEERRRRQQLTK
jgi:hypothetical protein